MSTEPITPTPDPVRKLQVGDTTENLGRYALLSLEEKLSDAESCANAIIGATKVLYEILWPVESESPLENCKSAMMDAIAQLAEKFQELATDAECQVMRIRRDIYVDKATES